MSLVAAIRSSSQPPEPQFLIWDTLEARIYHREAQVSIRKALQNCESVFKQWHLCHCYCARFLDPMNALGSKHRDGGRRHCRWSLPIILFWGKWIKYKLLPGSDGRGQLNPVTENLEALPVFISLHELLPVVIKTPMFLSVSLHLRRLTFI